MKNLILFLFSLSSFLIINKANAQLFTQLETAGGTLTDGGKFVDVDNQGNVFTTGYFEGTFFIGNDTLTSQGNEDVFVAKYNNAGDLLWSISIGAASVDIPAGICIDSAGNCYVSINWYSSNTPGVYLNSNLIPITHDGSANLCLLFKFDPQGNLLWHILADGPAFVNGGTLANNKNFSSIYWCVSPVYYLKVKGPGGEFLPPWCDSIPGLGCFTGFTVLKIGEDGIIQNYNFNQAGYSTHSVKMITVDANNDVYLTGEFTSRIRTLDPATGDSIYSFNAGSTSNAFIEKYTSAGGFVFFKNVGNDSSVVTFSGISVDASENVYLQGRFSKTCGFDSFTLIPSSANFDSFIGKLNSSATFEWINQIKSNNTPSQTYRMAVKGNNVYGCFWTNGNASITDQAGNYNQIFATNGRMYLTAFNNSGNLLWLTQFGKGSLFIFDKPNDINCFGNGIYLAGSFSGNSAFGNLTGISMGNSDAFLALVNSFTADLSVVMEGFYDNVTDRMNPDSALVILRNKNSPYSALDSSKVLLDSLGNGSFSFNNSSSTDTFYIVFKHRNSIETWSRTTEMFVNNSLSYDFTVSAAKAFGDNMKQVDTSPLKFAVFSGDVNQDESVDITDIISIYNDANIFASGYVVTDITGNDFVDLSDITIAFNNSSVFVTVVKP